MNSFSGHGIIFWLHGVQVQLLSIKLDGICFEMTIIKSELFSRCTCGSSVTKPVVEMGVGGGSNDTCIENFEITMTNVS